MVGPLGVKQYHYFFANLSQKIGLYEILPAFNLTQYVRDKVMHFNLLWVRLKIYRIEINGTVARLGRGYKTKK